MKNEKKVKKTKSEEKNKNKSSAKVKILSILSIIFAVVLVVGLCIAGYCIAQTIKYKEYTDQMYLYKYNELYSNQKATAYQRVTNLDMFKVIFGSINNSTKASNLLLATKTNEMTDEDVWYETAKRVAITSRIEREDFLDNATKLDAVITAMRIVELCVDEEVSPATLNIDEKKLEKYSTSDSRYIAIAVALGFLENDDSALNNKKLNKGELNKLVIEICNKYATVYYKDKYVNEEGKLVSSGVKIVTDKEKLPANNKEYPYIVDAVEKNEYEMPLLVENEKDFKNPKEVFEDMGELYSQIDETVSRYLNLILNVNYEEIDYINFKNALNRYSIYKLNDDDVEMYVEHVLDNKISLKGEAEILLPVMYYSGERYFVRTKITLEVLNGTTNKELLFGDLAYSVEYNGNKITMYVDIPLAMTLNSKSLYIEPSCLALRIVEKTDDVKVDTALGGLIYEKNK